MQVRHPLYNQVFEQQPDGLVRVEDLDAGTIGYFDRRGHHIRGDLTWADPQLIDWVGGRPLPVAKQA
ncbi:transposase [Amycolatopsis alkalitolerans]|uniref:Transposase n=1 Tax=Amycolatopsis alkalitolerans TaxID=2547244 RepID=A0A5C4MB36_9PSEU|nr:transposase [Amycolatopsis alkalitolerans]TNC29231.1 transposase [Amycolatopsis alkalitolerans]